MTITNAPAMVTQASTQLAACAGWTGGTANHWYPVAPDGSAVPFAVIDDQTAGRQIYASDAPGLPSGTIVITIVDSAARTIGQLEELGRTILAQLIAQASGIPFKSGEVGLVDDFRPATEAGEGTGALRSITMSIPYGLDA